MANRDCTFSLLRLLMIFCPYQGILGLRLVSHNVPSSAVVGDTIVLSCEYDLEGDTLYSVKWYKDQREFFRFLPIRHKNADVSYFPLAGVQVDVSRSDDEILYMNVTDVSATGTYTCEVATDAPFFRTVSYEKRLVVSGEATINDDYSHDDHADDDYEASGTEATSLTPAFLSSSVFLTATVGDTVTFPCEAEISNDVTISWKIKDKYVVGGNSTILPDDRFHIVNGTSLQISGVVPSDEGPFSCEISTQPVLELHHNLEVNSRPSDDNRCTGKSEKWIDLGGDFCYLINREIEVSWIDAVYQCVREGGSLATLQSQEEVKRLRRYFKGEGGILHIGLWKRNDGSFDWVDHSTSRFRNWAQGEPNREWERCVGMYTNSAQWNDIYCQDTLGYVCSALKAKTTPALGKVCPKTSPDWSDYGSEYCYIIDPYNATTSEEAAARCSAAGGTLATFHSVEEISIVRERSKYHHHRLHIGFRQNSDEMFEWMDRSPVDLDFWGAGEPNNIEEHCAEMFTSSGYWNDIPCDTIEGYICSTPKVYPETEAAQSPQVSEDVICGGDIIADKGTIQSPNYPESYNPNVNCFWKITVPENSRVVLIVQVLQLEYGAACEFDYVEILDGHDPDSTVLHKLCGSEAQQNIVSSGNKMAVKFSSDEVNQRSGFLAQFQKVEQCGGRITAEQGIIQSSNYPDNYRPNDVCSWKITVPEDSDKNWTKTLSGVLVTFKAFEIEDSPDCANDYVEILDGHDVTSKVWGRYCGSILPGEIRSSGHKITVRFASDGSKEYYGFSAEFKKVEVRDLVLPPELSVPFQATCQNAIDYVKGTLVSPNFPQPYKSDEDCTWIIRAPPGSFINLRIKNLEIESHSDCRYDYLSVYDGPDSSFSSLGRFCGSRVPNVITSSGNQLTVHFKTDSSNVRRGFSATFNTSEESLIRPEENDAGSEGACMEYIISDEGVIQSPNYPENYGPEENCTWKITVAANYQIVLDFTVFEIEEHVGCGYDYVLIRDGHSAVDSVLAKLCGRRLPKQIWSSGNKLEIEFKSDSSVEYRGFRIQFKKNISSLPEDVSKLGTCGGDIHSTNGTIQSPNYPSTYGPLEDCTWRITVPEDNLIFLRIDSLEVENSPECTFDAVTILDGDDEESPVLRTLCGDGIGVSVVSSKNRITVKFTSDDSFERQGFSATFKKAEICGETLFADRGVIHSPNTTDGFGYKCTWNIPAPENYTVHLNIHSDPKPNYQYGSFSLEIRNGVDSFGNVLLQSSSLDDQNQVRSTTNGMHIMVRSDGSETSPYFYAEFVKDTCGGDIVADSGVITSPNYPGNYYPSEDCRWRITVPEDYVIRLSFESFALEGSSCNFDFLKIDDGDTPYGSSLGTFCGNSIPNVRLSRTNKLSLRFVTDSSREYRGFSAKFEKILKVAPGCGGRISAETGVISSPGFPRPYPPHTSCIWKITVPDGNRVSLQFNVFDLEYNSDCMYDYVKIFDGPDTSNSPVLQKACGANIPDIVESTREEMTVTFVSDGSTQRNGFTAEFYSEPVSFTDVENVLRQLPQIIFSQAQKKEPSPGKKKKPIMKRSLLQALKGALKLL